MVSNSVATKHLHLARLSGVAHFSNLSVLNVVLINFDGWWLAFITIFVDQKLAYAYVIILIHAREPFFHEVGIWFSHWTFYLVLLCVSNFNSTYR